jgi:hypothetical protein
MLARVLPHTFCVCDSSEESACTLLAVFGQSTFVQEGPKEMAHEATDYNTSCVEGTSPSSCVHFIACESGCGGPSSDRADSAELCGAWYSRGLIYHFRYRAQHHSRTASLQCSDTPHALRPSTVLHNHHMHCNHLRTAHWLTTHISIATQSFLYMLTHQFAGQNCTLVIALLPESQDL